MLATVHFDNELASMAYEICDIITQGRLPSEMIALTTQQPELLPEPAFRLCRIVAMASGHAVGHLMTPTPSPSPQGGGETLAT